MSVLRYIPNISVKNFSDLVDSSILSVLLPEVFLNVRDGINSDSIKVEFLHCVLDPVK